MKQFSTPCTEARVVPRSQVQWDQGLTKSTRRDRVVGDRVQYDVRAIAESTAVVAESRNEGQKCYLTDTRRGQRGSLLWRGRSGLGLETQLRHDGGVRDRRNTARPQGGSLGGRLLRRVSHCKQSVWYGIRDRRLCHTGYVYVCQGFSSAVYRMLYDTQAKGTQN